MADSKSENQIAIFEAVEKGGDYFDNKKAAFHF